MDQLPDLIQRCKNDERKAQFELYRWWFNDLMPIAYRYKNNEEDAAALVNMAFFKILTNLHQYNEQIPFEGWIKRIMLNTVIDEFRKNRKFKQWELLEDGNHSMNISEGNLADRKFETEELESMLNGLSQDERLVFNLFEIDGFSHQEIAAKLGVSDRSSKRYLAKAKQRLKEMISFPKGNLLQKSSGILSYWWLLYLTFFADQLKMICYEYLERHI